MPFEKTKNLIYRERYRNKQDNLNCFIWNKSQTNFNL